MSELYYMRRLDELPEVLPPHALWQAPLLLPRRPDDLDERRSRIERACTLWLENFDLSTSTVLMLLDETTGELTMFQRPLERAGHGHRCVVRVSGSVLPEGELAPGPYGLVFEELIGDLRTSMPHLFDRSRGHDYA